MLKLAPNMKIMNEFINLIVVPNITSINWKNEICDKTAISNYKLFILYGLIQDLCEPELQIRDNAIFRDPEIRKKIRKQFIHKDGLNFLINTILHEKLNFIEFKQNLQLEISMQIITAYAYSSLKGNNLLPKNLAQIRYVKEEKSINSQQNDNYEQDPEIQKAIHESLKKTILSIFYLFLIKRKEKEEYYGELIYKNSNFLTELSQELKGEIGQNSIKMIINSTEIKNVLLKILEIHLEENEKMQNIADISVILLKLMIIYLPILYKEFTKIGLKDILLSGIISKKSEQIREFYYKILFFLTQNFTTKILDSPLGDLISSMLNFSKILEISEPKEFIEIIISSLEKLRKISDSNPEISHLFDKTTKLHEICNILHSYKSKEIAESSLADYGLCGLFKIGDKLIKMHMFSSELPEKLRFDLINEIYFNCLFPIKEKDTNHFKCKTNVSRKHAYKMLESITDFNENCITHLIKDCILPISEFVPIPATFGYMPDKDKRSEYNFAGIKNLGCTCYMNSMIQQFFLITPFRNALLSIDDNIPTNISNPFKIDDNMLHQLQQIFCNLLKTTRQYIDTSEFCYAFKGIDGKPTNTAIQQDAQEFLGLLFDRLERSLQKTEYKRLLQATFGGKVCNQLKCKSCNSIKRNYEDLYTLSLEIKNQHNFNDALTKFIQPTSVTGFFCEFCKTKVEVSKRSVLASLPNVLIVHLQRFTFNMDTGMQEKIHSRFEFPNLINLKMYTEEGCEIDKDTKKIIKENEYYEYKLVGIVVHSGNAQGGHYYSFININRSPEYFEEPRFSKPENDQWLEFNDRIVREFDFKKVPTECFGGEPSILMDTENSCTKSAYMLFYERKLKSAIPMLTIPEEIYMQMESQNIQIIQNLDSKLAENQGRIMFYKENEEIYRVFNFYNFPLNISDRIIEVFFVGLNKVK